MNETHALPPRTFESWMEFLTGPRRRSRGGEFRNERTPYARMLPLGSRLPIVTETMREVKEKVGLA